MAKTLRVRSKTGWVTKDPADLPENRLTAAEVDDNFLSIENAIENVVDDLAQLDDNLTASSGASQIGFHQIGIGAVARTVGSKLREWVSVKDFGAVGDGVADDSDALQNAINASGEVHGVFGDVYRITREINIPSNRVIDLKWSTIKRDFPNGHCLRNVNESSDGAAFDHNITIKNAKFRDGGKTDGTDFGAAIALAWCNDVLIDGVDVLFTSTQPSLMYGAWAFYLSGENHTVRNIKINNAAQGQQGDGVHCGYIKNFVMTDFNIRSGDDSISLFVPPGGWSFEGPNAPSENIVIGNGHVESQGYAGLKIGAHNNPGDPAPANSVYKNVLFHDITIGQVGSAAILLEDRREDPNIALCHDNIVFDNIRIEDQSDVFHLIAIFGDNEATTPAYRLTKNWGRVTLSNIEGKIGGGSNSLFRVNSVQRLTLKGVNIIQQYASPTSPVAMSLSHIDELFFDTCAFKTHTTSTALQLNFVASTRLVETTFTDIGNAFRCIEVWYNTSFRVGFIMSGGGIYGYQRCIQDNNSAGATNLMTDFVIDRVDLRGTVSDIGSTNFLTSIAGLNIRNLMERTVYSSGATGGAGSSGAGNQYVSLSIGGVTYKVLHDGII